MSQIYPSINFSNKKMPQFCCDVLDDGMDGNDRILKVISKVNDFTTQNLANTAWAYAKSAPALGMGC